MCAFSACHWLAADGVPCAWASAELKSFLLHLTPLIFFVSSQLVMFYHHSLLIPNLILTCLRIMEMLAEPQLRGLIYLGIIAVLKSEQ